MYVKDLNRLNDYLFKWIFGRNEHKEILLSFLNALLDEEIEDIVLQDRELDPAYITDKASRLDLRGKTNDGSNINIEIQINNQHNIDKRSLYYWGQLYQLEAGKNYHDLCRTVAINVLNFIFLPEEKKYHSMFGLYDIETGYRLNRDLEIRFLELPKWLKIAGEKKPLTRLEKWLTYLGNQVSEKEMEEIAMQEPAIRKALEVESIFLQTDQERYHYEMREKALHDYVSIMHSAKQDGIQEGIQVGLAKGIQQGLTKGIQQEKRETALKLLSLDIPLETIMKATGLREEEIGKLGS